MTPEQVNNLIRTRRSIYPQMLIDKPIPDEIIWELLENANYAPTHRLTQPWRFKVFTENGKGRLGQFLADTYKEVTPVEKFKESKFKKTLKKSQQAYAMIAICMQRDASNSVPEVEETNAVACAVQNIWLSAHAYNIGMYWSSPKFIYTQSANDFLGLKEGESCLGIIYMGYHEIPELAANRTPITEKVEWFKE
ncbi:MAG: nitroreductase [Saprospiraceae bacterium]|jgi:nitroreductase|tara:strand:- start:26 stop:607 length:582 start_codon:yes stop_codon:yes gene_type:complete